MGTGTMRGWRNTVGSLVEFVSARKSLSRASIYRYMHETQRDRVSSNSRIQTGAKHSALFNRRLVTTLYGCSIVAEQEHTRKSWMSRVNHPMLRLKPRCYDLSNILVLTNISSTKMGAPRAEAAAAAPSCARLRTRDVLSGATSHL